MDARGGGSVVGDGRHGCIWIWTFFGFWILEVRRQDDFPPNLSRRMWSSSRHIIQHSLSVDRASPLNVFRVEGLNRVVEVCARSFPPILDATSRGVLGVVCTNIIHTYHLFYLRYDRIRYFFTITHNMLPHHACIANREAKMTT